MSRGAVAALNRPKIRRRRSACCAWTPAFEPVSKNLANPLCLNPRITSGECNLDRYRSQERPTSIRQTGLSRQLLRARSAYLPQPDVRDRSVTFRSLDHFSSSSPREADGIRRVAPSAYPGGGCPRNQTSRLSQSEHPIGWAAHGGWTAVEGVRGDHRDTPAFKPLTKRPAHPFG